MGQTKQKLVVVLGPTASGKSTLGIKLAQHFQGEIVSADSRQVYQHLDIGTAKVTQDERALVPHHLLDVVAPAEVYTVSQFQQQATERLQEIDARGKRAFLVGGSPHYIQVVVDNLTMPHIPPQPALRADLEKQPLPELIKQLAELDPVSAATIDLRNPRRVIRALEVCLVSGKPFSQQRGSAEPLYDSLLLGINWPRPVLYQRIDQRVDERMQAGMVQEVRDLLARGISAERLEALGLEYRFITRLLQGEYKSEAEMVERLKFAIHDFTRRQLTWFRKETRIHWLAGEQGNYVAEALELVEQFYQQQPGLLTAHSHEA